MIGAVPEAEDVRRTITPEAFEVAPELLGRPLAAPWRRGVALLADLVLVFLFTRLGSLSAALAASVVFFLLVIRKPVERRWLRWTTRAAGALGALVLFLAVLVALEWSNPDPYTGMSPQQWMDFSAAAGSKDPEVRAQALEELAQNLQNVSQEQVQPVVDAFGLSGEPVDPDADDATARLERRIAQLQTNLRELRAENLELRDEVENPSFQRLASAVAGDLGLTFGWSAVYFTFCLAWWRGRTPGKWLFRLRVLRLDNNPLTLWGCFERFAGYAAGLATGLLGFLQIFWDPNRQAVHDKIVGTVVIMDKPVLVDRRASTEARPHAGASGVG